MFEGFGNNLEHGRRNASPAIDSDEESYIPGLLEDPRELMKEGSTEEIFQSENAPEEKSENPEDDLALSVAEFVSQIDLGELVKKRLDDDELREELDIRIGIFIAKKQAYQKKAGCRARYEEETWAEMMRNVVEMNLRDTRRLSRIKNFIRAHRDDQWKLRDFWSDFNLVFDNERGTRNKQCRYRNPTTIKSGILGELAAENMLERALDDLKASNYAATLNGIDLDALEFRVEDATPEEDVLEQTDLKLNIAYEGREFTLAVQAKCRYMENLDPRMAEDITRNACIFEQGNIRHKAPYGKEIKRFFDRYDKKGIFMVFPYGEHGYNIRDNGTPSDGIVRLIGGQLARGLADFLKKNLATEADDA